MAIIASWGFPRWFTGCQCLLEEQSDSMQENQMLTVLGKEDGKGGGGDNQGRKTWRRG